MSASTTFVAAVDLLASSQSSTVAAAAAKVTTTLARTLRVAAPVASIDYDRKRYRSASSQTTSTPITIPSTLMHTTPTLAMSTSTSARAIQGTMSKSSRLHSHLLTPSNTHTTYFSTSSSSSSSSSSSTSSPDSSSVSSDATSTSTSTSTPSTSLSSLAQPSGKPSKPKVKVVRLSIADMEYLATRSLPEDQSQWPRGIRDHVASTKTREAERQESILQREAQRQEYVEAKKKEREAKGLSPIGGTRVLSEWAQLNQQTKEAEKLRKQQAALEEAAAKEARAKELGIAQQTQATSSPKPAFTASDASTSSSTTSPSSTSTSTSTSTSSDLVAQGLDDTAVALVRKTKKKKKKAKKTKSPSPSSSSSADGVSGGDAAVPSSSTSSSTSLLSGGADGRDPLVMVVDDADDGDVVDDATSASEQRLIEYLRLLESGQSAADATTPSAANEVMSSIPEGKRREVNAALRARFVSSLVGMLTAKEYDKFIAQFKRFRSRAKVIIEDAAAATEASNMTGRSGGRGGGGGGGDEYEFEEESAEHLQLAEMSGRSRDAKLSPQQQRQQRARAFNKATPWAAWSSQTPSGADLTPEQQQQQQEQQQQQLQQQMTGGQQEDGPSAQSSPLLSFAEETQVAVESEEDMRKGAAAARQKKKRLAMQMLALSFYRFATRLFSANADHLMPMLARHIRDITVRELESARERGPEANMIPYSAGFLNEAVASREDLSPNDPSIYQDIDIETDINSVYLASRLEYLEKHSRKIFVENIPPTLTTRELMQAFAKCGVVLAVEIHRSRLSDLSVTTESSDAQAVRGVKIAKKSNSTDSSPVYGFVYLKTEEALRHALHPSMQIFGMCVQDMLVYTRPVESKTTLFVSGFRYRMSHSDATVALRAALQGEIDFSDIVAIKFPFNEGRNRGFAFVEFKSHSVAARAFRLLDGSTLRWPLDAATIANSNNIALNTAVAAAAAGGQGLGSSAVTSVTSSVTSSLLDQLSAAATPEQPVLPPRRLYVNWSTDRRKMRQPSTFPLLPYFPFSVPHTGSNVGSVGSGSTGSLSASSASSSSPSDDTDSPSTSTSASSSSVAVDTAAMTEVFRTITGAPSPVVEKKDE